GSRARRSPGATSRYTAIRRRAAPRWPASRTGQGRRSPPTTAAVGPPAWRKSSTAQAPGRVSLRQRSKVRVLAVSAVVERGTEGAAVPGAVADQPRHALMADLHDGIAGQHAAQRRLGPQEATMQEGDGRRQVPGAEQVTSPAALDVERGMLWRRGAAEVNHLGRDQQRREARLPGAQTDLHVLVGEPVLLVVAAHCRHDVGPDDLQAPRQPADLDTAVGGAPQPAVVEGVERAEVLRPA